MTIELGKYPEFLERVASEIDIPPSKYQNAVDRYQAVGRWLEAGGYPGAWGQPSIYPQGSFRLGTVVRPIRRGIEAGYDIDLVCEMPLTKHLTTPYAVKHMVGDRLRQHETYRRLLDDEGRRCWTLEYAEQDGVGFHLDVLPAVPDGSGLQSTAISITHKADSYSWSASDPCGYGKWFDGKNADAFARVVVEQKQIIQRQASLVFESVDDVPDQLVRTPLQRSIQPHEAAPRPSLQSSRDNQLCADLDHNHNARGTLLRRRARHPRGIVGDRRQIPRACGTCRGQSNRSDSCDYGAHPEASTRQMVYRQPGQSGRKLCRPMA